MVCSSCSFEFEGNFCPNCGAKAIETPTAPIPLLQEPYHVTIGGIEFDVNLVIRVYGLGARKIGTITYISQLSGTTISKVREIVDPIIQHHIQAGEHVSILSGVPAQAELSAWEAGIKAARKNAENTVSSNTGEFRQVTETAPAAKNRPLTKHQRIKENKKNGVACCPKCGSTSLTANKKGFGVVKSGLGALAAGALTGGVGAVVGLGAGNLGAKKVWVTCLNCGHRWKL